MWWCEQEPAMEEADATCQGILQHLQQQQEEQEEQEEENQEEKQEDGEMVVAAQQAGHQPQEDAHECVAELGLQVWSAGLQLSRRLPAGEAGLAPILASAVARRSAPLIES
jgi:hypothetical protein